MAVKVLMPKGSDTMTEGKVLKWLKKEGEPVATGDTLLEIETDKVDMEVEAMGSGVLRKVLVDAGKSVPVGDVLAVIGKPDEDISALTKPKVSAPPAAPAAVTSTSTPPATGRTLPSPAAPAEGGRVMASPLARRMALEMGLDINRVTGSGPGGRIIRQDIERMAALTAGARHLAAGLGAETPAPIQAPGVSPIPAPVPSLPRPTMPAPGGPEFYDEPLSSMRKTIAARLVQSLGPVPHFYLTVDVDMQRAKELRESANLLDPTLKLSYNDIILKACAAALRQHPEVNSSFQGESIRYHNRVHVGMAVAVDGGGLITPVIRNCDGKTLSEIARGTKDLAARARTRKLLPNEYVGSTFSVSNLGMMGIEEFTAVINPPEGAILAVGTVAEKAVVLDGRIVPGLRCRLTLSCDHRVVDGATGARFLQTLKQILENPVYLAF